MNDALKEGALGEGENRNISPIQVLKWRNVTWLRKRTGVSVALLLDYLRNYVFVSEYIYTSQQFIVIY